VVAGFGGYAVEEGLGSYGDGGSVERDDGVCGWDDGRSVVVVVGWVRRRVVVMVVVCGGCWSGAAELGHEGCHVCGCGGGSGCWFGVGFVVMMMVMMMVVTRSISG